jgi:hypothetical protein
MRGIAIVAFGEMYERLAAKCLYYSRDNIEYPIEVFTNQKNTSELWNKLDDVELVFLDMSTDNNRNVKTSIIDYTSFDECLYTDCDMVFQKKGMARFFDMIPNNGVVLNTYSRWQKTHNIPRLYMRAFSNAGIELPVKIYYGACMLFKKCDKVEIFFKLWNKYWRENGRGRDMPSLACAAKNSKIDIVALSRGHGLFSWPPNNNVIIQHEYGKRIRTLVGFEKFKPYKPFDRRGFRP